MTRTTLLSWTANFTAVAFATAAQAKTPVFAAQWPMGGNGDADPRGRWRIGGQVATVTRFNASYYEARHAGVTLQYQPRWGGRGLSASSKASGGRNGQCTILSAGAHPPVAAPARATACCQRRTA